MAAGDQWKAYVTAVQTAIDQAKKIAGQGGKDINAQFSDSVEGAKKSPYLAKFLDGLIRTRSGRGSRRP